MKKKLRITDLVNDDNLKSVVNLKISNLSKYALKNKSFRLLECTIEKIFSNLHSNKSSNSHKNGSNSFSIVSTNSVSSKDLNNKRSFGLNQLKLGAILGLLEKQKYYINLVVLILMAIYCSLKEKDMLN